jgi:hypothetical protein
MKDKRCVATVLPSQRAQQKAVDNDRRAKVIRAGSCHYFGRKGSRRVVQHD